jgi:hypothetical protein
MVPMGLWTGFEGGWVIVAYSILVLLSQRRILLLALVLISLGTIFLVGLSVVDISRSTAYVMPMVYVSILVIARSNVGKDFKPLLVTGLLLTIFWAPYYAGGERTIWWQYPLPIQVFRWLLLT